MNKKDILTILYIIALVVSVVGIMFLIDDPVTIEDLTVEERIRYERSIFP